VKIDLEACLNHITSGKLGATLTLRGSDTSSVLQIPEKLYGRDTELKALMACFTRVRSTGRTEMAVVAGAGGVGKSRLVGELLAMVSTVCAATAHTPVFASGKFDQYTRRPFSAIIAAISQLVDYVLGQDASQLAAIRARMLHKDTGLGSNVSVAIQLVSSVALITGPQPAAPPLGQAEAQNRLHRTFVQLLRIFATSTTPLVLFVDDLQWADQPSLQLIQQLTCDSDFRHCFIVAAYRDNEVGRAHPLTEILDLVAKSSSLTAMTLKPLTRPLIVQLLVDTLRCNEGPKVIRLAQICLSKTHGNPFFVIELIRSLYQQGHAITNPLFMYQFLLTSFSLV
jgi:histidine kinase